MLSLVIIFFIKMCMCTASSTGLFLHHPFSFDLFHYCTILKFDSRDTYTHSLDLAFVQNHTATQIKILSPEEDSIQSMCEEYAEIFKWKTK